MEALPLSLAMKILDFYENRINLKEVVYNAARYLSDGRVIVYPTDTVYGFGCDAFNIKAVKRIAKIKQRTKKQPLSVVMRNLDMIKKYAQVDEKQEERIKKLLPGQYTVILEQKKKFPEELTAGEKTIGIRIPDYDLTREISQEFDRPYVTTTVNISGETPQNWGVEIVETYNDPGLKPYLKPDLIIDAGKLHPEAPGPVVSAVIDLTGKRPRVLRAGRLSPEEIFKILK